MNAVWLMYAGAAISAISLIITLVTVGSLKTAIHNADPALTAAKLHNAEVAAVVVAIVFGLIGIGLWLWMARANKAGKSWARITATVFFGLDTLSVLAGLSPGRARAEPRVLAAGLAGRAGRHRLAVAEDIERLLRRVPAHQVAPPLGRPPLPHSPLPSLAQVIQVLGRTGDPFSARGPRAASR